MKLRETKFKLRQIEIKIKVRKIKTRLRALREHSECERALISEERVKT